MTMTAAPHSIDPATYLDDLLAQASPDLMRQMLQGFINQILSAQADTVCSAEYGVASEQRVNHRNGYRHRELDTRVGTIDVAVPKLRQGAREGHRPDDEDQAPGEPPVRHVHDSA
ncbi:transposase [Corynebacterium sp. NML98-0116]|nr:transposase [Corynebacterium sp. NML98-0116]